jgi:hypothetical protein
VDAGSSTTRALGIAGLAIGTPVAMAGLILYGYGATTEADAIRTAGVLTLVVGAAVTLTALPLLAMGTTTVRDSRGEVIAVGRATPRM